MSPASVPNETSRSSPELAEKLNDEARDKYVKDRKLGEGTYAIVYLGHEAKNPSSLVAIKKIKLNPDFKDGLAMDAIREVKTLQEISHPNIIALRSVFSSKNQLNLVLEYLPLGDLEMLIKDHAHIAYGAADMKAWMGMLCRGIWFCHANFILHRDIKPNNLLISASGEIKLADFGLARSFADPYHPMTHQVITRWYRPPELFLRARHYAGAVDMWSVGTVFAELILRAPFLPGESDLAQLALIAQRIGSPTEDNWPGVSQLEAWVPTPTEQIVPLHGREHYKRLFGAVGDDGVDLLMGMLTLDPRRRVGAQKALEHRWWRAAPRPTKTCDLPRKSEGAEEKMGADLKRRAGELDLDRGGKVARKLDFAKG